MRYTVYCRVWVGEKARESEEKEGRGREKILYQRREKRGRVGEKETREEGLKVERGKREGGKGENETREEVGGRKQERRK